ETARSLQALAEIAQLWGKLDEAKKFCDRALKIRELLLGPNHPETAETVLSAAFLSDDPSAEALNKRAIAIFEKTLGPEHPSTALALSGLSTFYTNASHYKDAVPLADRAVRICE